MMVGRLVVASAATAPVALFAAGVAVIALVGVAVGRRPPRRPQSRDTGPWIPGPARGRGILASGAARVVVLGALMAGGFLATLGVGSIVGFLTRMSAVDRLNHDVLGWFVAHRSPWLDDVMR